MSKENFENETKSDSNFAPSFADHHALPDINFNEQCLINNIHNKYIYFLHPKSMSEKFQHRFYIK